MPTSSLSKERAAPSNADLTETLAHPGGPAAFPDSVEAASAQRGLLSEATHQRILASGYQIVRLLGEGTYGTVWLAVEENTGIRAAIKVFVHGTGQQWRMLQDEVRQLAALDDANGIVHLKEVVADANPPFYIMSYAEGGSLDQRLENGPMPLKESLRIFTEVVQTLAYVHAHGIRHCDIKPGNILLDSLGRPLVADFGQAHLSDDAAPALGTFFYMAPEQADLDHKIPDTRWDVYGLGALFYAMLTGEPPRRDETLSNELSGTKVLDHRLCRYREGIAGTPAPTAHRRLPGMDKPLAAIVDGCLELDPKKRLANADAILQALEKRRVHQRQFPLLVYGLAGPLIVVVLMATTGLGMFHHEIGRSQEALQNQVLEGDRVMAKLLANGMELGLKQRIASLRKLLERDSGKELHDLLAQETIRRRASGAAQAVGRDRGRDWMKNAVTDSAVHMKFSGLSITDADGFIVMRGYWDETHPWNPSPQEEEIWTLNWSWRDWFNGRGRQARGKIYPPITAPHISQPFLSQEKNRGVVMDVCVPVKGDDGAVVGVLTGILTWKEFNSWNENVTINNGKIVVFNQRGQAMKHQTGGQDDVEAAIISSHESNPPAYADELARQLKPGTEQDVCDSFQDPYQSEQGGICLAGYQFFNPNEEELDSHGPLGARWGVIVEHNKDEVLAPVGQLSQFITTHGLWMLAGIAAATGAVWLGLIWLLRRGERLGHG